MRRVMAVVAGLLAMFVIVIAVELLGPIFHPIPAGLNPNDNAALGRWVASAPFSTQAVIVAAWFLGALGGGWVAQRLSGWAAAAWIVAFLDAALAVFTLFRFDHPLWMQIGAVVAPALGGWLATRFGSVPAAAADPIDG